ncbi:hypothetical protein Vau01_097140 [Virgisporangium aurantiacum]|uniref:AMP-dependent synthetase/ligase domain-containing protein n=2 Tax=Virgisporangium aurantiacum TaxID=175570 RepID=A0A8J3ZIU4_9ACTN|nr:hypothetical protein Vau01_097140 [Virgisporangium aurantiacum]
MVAVVVIHRRTARRAVVNDGRAGSMAASAMRCRMPGRCVLVPGDAVTDGVTFAEVVRREGVTVLNIVPSVFRRLLSAVIDNDLHLPDLRQVIFGGEAIDPDDIRRWWVSSTAPRATLHSMYGITE